MLKRIYVKSFNPNLQTSLLLSIENSHYLINVLRCKNQQEIIIFNENAGEWIGQIIIPNNRHKSVVTIADLRHYKTAKLCSVIWLAFAPIKHEPLDFLLEKTTELGVTHLQPVITDRCNIKNFHLQRWQTRVVEAAQQSGRFDLPNVLPVKNFNDFLNNPCLADPTVNIRWLVCIEPTVKMNVLNIAEVIKNTPFATSYGFFIGPEGGFSPRELEQFANNHQWTAVSLGNLILRAETAAISAISYCQLSTMTK